MKVLKIPTFWSVEQVTEICDFLESTRSAILNQYHAELLQYSQDKHKESEQQREAKTGGEGECFDDEIPF